MTIYVLTNRSYSDTHIVGLYSTRELAELASRVFRDESSIEEWDVDAAAEEMKRGAVPWFVRLHREDGSTIEVHPQESSYGAFSSDVGQDIHKNLYTHVWAAARDEAVKIAGDRRRMFLASEVVS